MECLSTEEEKWETVRQFLPLISKIAKGYTTESLDYDDLIQEGYLLVYEELSNYDASKGMKLSTFLLTRLRWHFYALSISSRFQLFVPKIHRLNSVSLYHQESLSLTTSHCKMTLEEKKEKMKLSASTIRTLEWINEYARDINFTYLDKEYTESENHRILSDYYDDRDSDFFPNTYQEKTPGSCFVEEEVVNHVMAEEALEILEKLPSIQQKIVSLRMGLEDGKAKLFEEIGEELGFSYQYANRLYQKGVKTLRKKLGVR